MPVAASSSRLVRWWPLTLVLLLLPLWTTGLFGRWYWTPDEPREADIAWNMASQQQKAVPELAGEAFCEKPPLTYWASGASMALLGKSPAAARLPNLLWAMLSVLAIAWLAYAMAGAGAALVAGIATGTFSLSFQVAIWLASDAPLVAGSCVALLGAFRGVTATTSRDKLIWYTVMHAGLVLGFMAKNVVGWIVPCLALGGFILWERRWRELLRYELYAGLLLQALVLVPWILVVAAQPDGQHHLKIFFYDNLIGRFLPVASEAGYRDGHRNLPGKYLLELPVYLLPWLFLAIAAIRSGWSGLSTAATDRVAWRWIACATIPATLLLSASSTARGIYLAPVMPGFALAIALWASRHWSAPDSFDRICLWLTVVLVAVAAFAVGPGCLLLAGLTGFTLDQGTIAAVIIGGLAAGVLGFKVLVQQRRGAWIGALATAVLALDVAMLVAGTGVFPVIDRWQDLTPTIRQVAQVVQTRPVILYMPDETITANLSYSADLRLPRVDDVAAAQAALRADPQALLLVRVRSAGDPADLLAAGLQITQTFDIPHGRTYALLTLTP